MNTGSDPYKVQRVTDIEEFASLKQVWNKLIDDGCYDFTASWQWMFSWWQVYRDDRELYILTFSIHNTIVAIFPLQRIKLRRHGIKYKIIQFLGTGENERDETCSEYLDMIITPQYRELVINLFVDYIQARPADWDVIELADIRKSAANYPVLLASRNPFEISCQEASVRAPYIELPDTWEGLVSSTRINAREQLNRKSNLISKAGHIEFKRYSGLDISETIMQCFVNLHQKRWQPTGKPGCFSSQLFTDFHNKLVAQCAEEGYVVIYLLMVDNTAVAARYCFEFKHKIYDYQTGLDTTFASRASPGTVLLAHVIQDSILRGKESYEFFKGKKGSYKYKWTCKDEALITVLIRRKTIKNRLFQAMDALLTLVRGLHRHFRGCKQRLLTFF